MHNAGHQDRSDQSERVEGSFEQDVPKRVTKMRLDSGRLVCSVEWYQRDDGTFPEPTLMPTTLVKENSPRILCDFYESKLKIRERNQIHSQQ